MKSLLLQGKGLLGNQNFKKFYASVKPSNPDIFKKFHLKGVCAKAVKALFKDKDFLNQILEKEDTAKGNDEGDDADESVSVFQKTYKKILFEALSDRELITEADDKKFLIVKKGDDITILDSDHNDVEDVKLLKRIYNYVKANKDQLKGKAGSEKNSKDMDAIFSLDSFSQGFQAFQDKVLQFNKNIPEDALTEDMYEKLIKNLRFESFKKRAINNGYKPQQLKPIIDDTAKLLAALFAAKYSQAVEEDKNKAKATSSKKNKEKWKKFVQQAKAFQAELPAAKIAEICDLPGSADVKISTGTKMYDINGKESNQWTLDQEIDSKSQIQEWRAFLNTGDGTDTPAHPQAIAAALAQELAGLAKASRINI